MCVHARGFCPRGIGHYSQKFVQLIGKSDPVATFSTLILICYAKLILIIIIVFSSAEPNYPTDGEPRKVWFPDASVKYFEGKHVPLIIVAVMITIVGVLYTLLLLFWQLFLRAPAWRIFRWTRNTKLNGFIGTYHTPFHVSH